MPQLSFTQNLRRHVDCPEISVSGETLREVLEAAFAENPKLKGYILDDQGALHKHVAIMVNGEATQDRAKLLQKLSPDDQIYVMQALSGG